MGRRNTGRDESGADCGQVLVVLFVVLGVVGGVGLAWVANWRAQRQPISAWPDKERLVLLGVIQKPERYSDAVALRPEYFTIKEYGEVWEAFERHAVPSSESGVVEKTEKMGLEPRELPSGIVEILVDEGIDLEEVILGGTREDSRPVSDKDFLKAGQAVLDGYEDRELGLSGVLRLEPTGDSQRPLRWQQRGVGRRRVSVAALCGGLGGWLVAVSGLNAWGAVALVALVAGCIVLALVDVDTLFIDLPTLGATAVVGYGCAAMSGVGDWWLTLGGMGVVVVLLLVLGALYARVRGTVGLGGGDLQLLVITFGLPLALTGSPLLAMNGLLLASALAVGVRLAMVVGRKTTFKTPFALGPYLCGGWALAWGMGWGL